MSFHEEIQRLLLEEEVAQKALFEAWKVVQPKFAAFTNPTEEELSNYLDAGKVFEDIKKQTEELLQKRYRL